MPWSLLRRIDHAVRLPFARWLASLHLHKIEHGVRDGRDVVIKSRRRGSGFAIWMGNLYLRCLGAKSRVLDDAEWLRWEQAVDAAHGEFAVVEAHCTAGAATLVQRRENGRPLADVLADSTLDRSLRLQAFVWAVESLQQLHSRQADWGGGRQQSISHGDATAANVVVDLAASRATWIDFDTRHQPQLTALERRSDDLRALLCSAAVHWPTADYIALVHTLRSRWHTVEGLLVLQERLHAASRFNTYELAQAALSWSDYRSLCLSLCAHSVPRGRSSEREDR
jgi:hypothetical protein